MFSAVRRSLSVLSWTWLRVQVMWLYLEKMYTKSYVLTLTSVDIFALIVSYGAKNRPKRGVSCIQLVKYKHNFNIHTCQKTHTHTHIHTHTQIWEYERCLMILYCYCFWCKNTSGVFIPKRSWSVGIMQWLSSDSMIKDTNHTLLDMDLLLFLCGFF